MRAGSTSRLRPIELVRYALRGSDYWAELAIRWMEQGLPALDLEQELHGLESEGRRPLQLRHRARHLRKTARQTS